VERSEDPRLRINRLRSYPVETSEQANRESLIALTTSFLAAFHSDVEDEIGQSAHGSSSVGGRLGNSA
jgi:hypothetical protein